MLVQLDTVHSRAPWSRKLAALDIGERLLELSAIGRATDILHLSLSLPLADCRRRARECRLRAASNDGQNDGR